MTSTDQVIINQQTYKTSDIPGVLQKIRASSPQYEKLSVQLRGSKSMKYKDLSDFMKACSKAQIVDVTFATTEQQ
jgi:biopolymer transport protein ExbD